MVNLSALPELFGTDVASRDLLSRRTAQGRIRRLGQGIYTNNLVDPPEQVVRRNLWLAIAMAVPDALITDRTALEAKPAPDGSVFVVSKRARPAALPGIIIRPRAGMGPLPTDMPLPGGIAMASRARAFLENLRPRRRGSGTPRVLEPAELEALLEGVLRTSGESALNRLRDEARGIAEELGMEAEATRLDELVGALQGTRSGRLSTAQGRARAAGRGFDTDRLELLAALHAQLRSQPPVERPAPPIDAAQVRHLPFFEAYFSNFIEGTEFLIGEAADIVYESAVPSARTADAHDVSGTYEVVADAAEMRRTPKSADDLLDLLRSRHATVMGGRPDKRPGEFKVLPNRAGSTQFVLPDLVEGTLRRAFELYQSLETAFERASYLAFAVSEVHPFDDGNGRIARIMMNAELVAADEWRVVVPTVYRNNYLQALRALTHNANPAPLGRMLEFAQRYTAALDYSDIDRTSRLLEATNALRDSNEADQAGDRLQLPTAETFAAVEAMEERVIARPWDEALVERGIWLPKHHEFDLAIGDGMSLRVSDNPTPGEQTWMRIHGVTMSVKVTGLPLAQAARFRPLLEAVYEAFDQDGDAATVGRRFAIDPT